MSFGNQRIVAKQTLRPLLVAIVYLGRTEKPYQQFSGLLETCEDMGVSLTSAFSNDKSAKVFNHIVAEQMIDNLRDTVSKGNFNSWLIDGSAAAKRRLTYASELVYIRNAYCLEVKVELFSFVSMQNYGTVNAENLYHSTTPY